MKIEKLQIDESNLYIVSDSNKLSIFEQVFSFHNLYIAYKISCKGVNWKTSIKNYKRKAIQNIAIIHKQLLEHNYNFKPYRTFIIKDRGRMRSIKAPYIDERIIQKCLCNNYLIENISKRLIYDNCATLRGRGLSHCLKRLKTHLQKYYRQFNTNNGYILTIDFHHYFESINHEILFNKMKMVITDNDIFTIYKYFINKYSEKGLGLGSEISQISALYYLNELDHYIKEKLHCKYYARYMDDCYIIANTKEELKYYLVKIKEIVNKLDLELNEKKTKISKLNNFMLFNRHWSLKENNYVYIKPARKTILRLRKHYKKAKLNNKDTQFLASLQGYFNYYSDRRVKNYV